jgi:prefoldin beta subunit
VQELVQQRARVQQQHTENSMVMQELELANTEDGVYKLVGPVLMKQEHSEAKETVSRRLEYLTGELKKLDAQLAEQDKVQNTKREKLQEIQAIMHKFVQLSQQQSNRG